MVCVIDLLRFRIFLWKRFGVLRFKIGEYFGELILNIFNGGLNNGKFVKIMFWKYCIKNIFLIWILFMMMIRKFKIFDFFYYFLFLLKIGE